MEKSVAHLKLREEPGARPILEVHLPRDTNIKASGHVLDKLDSVIEKLTGCPCVSGLDLRIFEHVLIEQPKAFQQDISLRG